jgi:hypothetical protein
MRKELGPITLINTKPTYRGRDDNQATYAFFPIFISFVLVLLSGLSTPIIPGLGIAKVDTHVNGTIMLGSWGWCTSGVPNIT